MWFCGFILILQTTSNYVCLRQDSVYLPCHAYNPDEIAQSSFIAVEITVAQNTYHAKVCHKQCDESVGHRQIDQVGS